MTSSRWVHVVGRNGLAAWNSDLGSAYTSQRPPEEDPLTAEEVQALPKGTRLLVLWGGGNGPHEYVWRDGKVFCPDSDDTGDRLGGLIGEWDLVGTEPYQDKVWLSERSE